MYREVTTHGEQDGVLYLLPWWWVPAKCHGTAPAGHGDVGLQVRTLLLIAGLLEVSVGFPEISTPPDWEFCKTFIGVSLCTAQLSVPHTSSTGNGALRRERRHRKIVFSSLIFIFMSLLIMRFNTIFSTNISITTNFSLVYQSVTNAN